MAKYDDTEVLIPLTTIPNSSPFNINHLAILSILFIYKVTISMQEKKHSKIYISTKRAKEF